MNGKHLAGSVRRRPCSVNRDISSNILQFTGPLEPEAPPYPSPAPQLETGIHLLDHRPAAEPLCTIVESPFALYVIASLTLYRCVD